MQISEIMNLIDENKLNEVGKLYKIDKVNNKITGKFIIKSFVHCIYFIFEPAYCYILLV